MTSSVMKIKKSPELNLAPVMMKKPISFLSPSDGLDIYAYCKETGSTTISKDSKDVPGVVSLVYEEIVKSFGIDKSDISGFTTKVFLPGVEDTVSIASPTTHSRYIIVVNVPKSKDQKDENGISAEDALLSVLGVVGEDVTPPVVTVSKRRGRLSKYPTQKELDEKAAATSKQHNQQQHQQQHVFKAREVLNFSVGVLSKEMLIEEGTIVGLHNIGASSLSFSFTNERKVTLSSGESRHGHDTRKTTVSKNPDRRILLVVDAEMSMAGAAKTASKLTSMFDKKKAAAGALPPGFTDLIKSLAPTQQTPSSSLV